MKEKNAVEQNLEDAGCPEAFICKYMKYYNTGNEEAQMKMLMKQRCGILECVHESERRLECLDYLIYQMKKKKERK